MPRKMLIQAIAVWVVVCAVAYFGSHRTRKENRDLGVARKVQMDRTEVYLGGKIAQAREMLSREQAGFQLCDKVIWVPVPEKNKAKSRKGIKNPRKAKDKKAGVAKNKKNVKVQKSEGQKSKKRKPAVKKEKRPAKKKNAAPKLKKVIVKVVCSKNFLIAAMNKRDGRITLVNLGPKRTRVDGFVVTKEGNPNGAGTRFMIRYPSGYMLLAVRSVVGRPGNKFQEVINSPFSPDLDIPAVHKAGMEKLVKVIHGARRELREKRVYSRSFKDKLLADVVSVKLSVALAINEHVDPNRAQDLWRKGESIAPLVREVLQIIWSNGPTAYNYSVSPAGARALWQFIPRTYKSIDRQFPEVGLHDNPVLGMEDHHNAAMANMCLADSDLSQASRHWRVRFHAQPSEAGRYLAAAYNGGAGRANAALARGGSNWTAHLLSETRIYVRKLDEIWDILGEGYDIELLK